jgi:hypothetical protein
MEPAATERVDKYAESFEITRSEAVRHLVDRNLTDPATKAGHASGLLPRLLHLTFRLQVQADRNRAACPEFRCP